MLGLLMASAADAQEAPGRVPAPGPVTDAPYAPQCLNPTAPASELINLLVEVPGMGRVDLIRDAVVLPQEQSVHRRQMDRLVPTAIASHEQFAIVDHMRVVRHVNGTEEGGIFMPGQEVAGRVGY